MSILVLVGARSNRVRFGFILMAFILSLFIPAQAANAALMTAIAVGVIQGFNLDPKGNMAKSLLLIVAFGTGVAGMGILTSGAPPIQTAKYIADATGYKISWLEWAMYGLPFAISVAAVLYFLVTKLFPPEMDEMPGGKVAIKERLKKLGKISARERNLLIIMVLTIALWVTGDHLHKIDSSTIALLTVVAIFFPPFKIAGWKELAEKVNWGTLMLFGGAISLGTYLLSTGAAAWVAKNTIMTLGIEQWPILGIIAAGSLFFAIFSLAFSARSAAVAALVPVAIGLAQALGNGVNVWGLTLILYYSIQFSVIMPVNTPMSMVAYSTDTFSVSDMMKVGIPLVISAVILVVIFSATYWSWLGLVK
ncbi:MAG TPA: SLC13 family permease [Desulfosporosinus sp.]|nr:SLC13 family permease [Desulfosporosinus sp.]